MELFMSQKQVKIEVIRMARSAVQELYPGRKKAIARERKIIIPQSPVRSVRTFPTIFRTIVGLSLCSDISRTVIV
jgi:hypothetical protein